MTDCPIIFSAPMVRALLDGRKTQTRRLLRTPSWALQPLELEFDDDDGREPAAIAKVSGCFSALPLPYAVGDRLWVREAHYLTDDGDEQCVVHAVDQQEADRHIADITAMARSLGLSDEWLAPHVRLRPSIHMHRWASRLTLTVTDVRVQRLHEISFADARAEGCDVGFREEAPDCKDPTCRGVHTGEKWHFQSVWSNIHGPDAWEANPWVAAISFAVEPRNIDASVPA